MRNQASAELKNERCVQRIDGSIAVHIGLGRARRMWKKACRNLKNDRCVKWIDGRVTVGVSGLHSVRRRWTNRGKNAKRQSKRNECARKYDSPSQLVRRQNCAERSILGEGLPPSRGELEDEGLTPLREGVPSRVAGR